MTKAKYPKIGELRKCKPQGLCAICKQPKANARLDVQVNQFRGDDNVYKVHTACIKYLGNDSAVILRKVRS